MLHQESGGYSPTPFPTASAGEHDVAATPTNSFRSGTPGNQMTHSARQRMSQQQLLRHSMGGRASYVAGMRSSTAYTADPDGGHQLVPMVTSPTSPAAADNHAGLYRGSTNANAMDMYAGGSGTMQPYTSPQNAALTSVGEDFVHEVLAMNTMAMEQCYAALGSAAQSATATEEPMKILREAFMRLDDSSAQDLPGPLLDQLKATTLNNMGVVECNRGQPRQALSHFEAARQLEENNDMASPSVALNTCAAYNALHMYDKATAAALEAIDMLRALEAQRQRSRKIAAAVARQRLPTSTAGRSTGRSAKAMDADDDSALDEALLLEAATAPQIAESQNAALWGAAWNNLAIAQINTARDGASKDTSEYTNTLMLFQNAMRATQDLLGPQHPMTRAVVETFRSVRLALRNHGAFKQHRTLLRAPLPPVDPREQAWEEEQVEALPGQTRHNALVKQRQQLTITFRGDVTGGQKLVERVDGTPYPGAAAEAYQAKRRAPASSVRSSSKKRSGKRSASSGKSGVNPALRGMPHSETLTRASIVYGNPHPLLYTPPPPQRHASASAPPSLPVSGRSAHEYEHGYANTEDATRHARPPPPSTKSSSQQQQGAPRRPPKHCARQLSSSARASGSPTGKTPALPPIMQGKRAEYSQADDDAMNGTTGTNATGVSSVFMHVPPPRPSPPVPSSSSSRQQPQPMDSTAARLQHAKMLLLASPASAADGSYAADHTAPTYHLEAAGGPCGMEQPSQLNSAGDYYTNAESINSRGPLTPSPTKSAEENGAHELYQGMWVTADAHYVHRGPRVFGRPVYYTISTTLDVDEDGVSGTSKAANGGNAAAGGPTASSARPVAHTTLPTLTYSESSSDEEALETHSRTGGHHSDGDDEGANYAEGEEEEVVVGDEGNRPHSADAAEI